MEAPSIEQLRGLLPALAAAPRPHLISIAWVALAQLASKELAAAGPKPAAPSMAGSGAHSNGARASQGRATAAAEAAAVAAVAERVVQACGQLQPLTREFMGSMQFAQLSGLFWAWGRLVQSVGAPAVGARMVEAAAARVAACRTDDEAQGVGLLQCRLLPGCLREFPLDGQHDCTVAIGHASAPSVLHILACISSYKVNPPQPPHRT
jgi:hypothetical protein